MKKAFLFFVIAGALIACKKNNGPGTVLYKVQYTNDASVFKTKQADSLHSGFGDYITSITPHHFAASINMMGMQNDTNPQDNTTTLLSFIMDNGQSMIMPEPQADFSNNQEVEFSPEIQHQYTAGQEINFLYFYFVPYYIYQELTLPAEYENISINQFNETYNINYFGIGQEQYYCDSVKTGTTLKIKYIPFITRLHPYPAGYPQAIVFGNCDSTFIYNAEGNLTQNSVDHPFPGGSHSCSIRSNKYESPTITIPENGETLTLHTTVGFDTENLIQVYAGADNIAYTADDIFVYAPRYWERIVAKLEVRE